MAFGASAVEAGPVVPGTSNGDFIRVIVQYNSLERFRFE
jgi:hypothetical protein